MTVGATTPIPRDLMVARIRGVTKSFAGTFALKGVDLDLEKGEIHSLVGGNGSGKSTLIKIIAGIQPADSGTLEIAGSTNDLSQVTPDIARKFALHFVHQEHSTFPDLTVAENLAIGHGFETTRLGRVKEKASRSAARAALDRFGVDARPEAELGTLRPAEQTMVAIVRALQDQEGSHDGVLVLDEPTAALPSPEVMVLLEALKRYAAMGQTVLFVSHRLEEVMEISDRVTIFRDGERVATREREGLTKDEVVRLMVGRELDVPEVRPNPPYAESVLTAEGLTGGTVQGVDLEVASGEIVGVTGLAGAGSSTLLRLIFGAQPIEAGKLKVAGNEVTRWSIEAAMAAGVALVPSDRNDQGLFPEQSVAENMTAATLGRHWRHGRISERRVREDCAEGVRTYRVRTSSLKQPIYQLSGGNQQKVMMARWLTRDPHLILLDEPTQGVDVGSRADLWTIIRDAVSAGACAIAASSDLDELVEVSDRIIVLDRGRIAHEVRGPTHAGQIVDLLHTVQS